MLFSVEVINTIGWMLFSLEVVAATKIYINKFCSSQMSGEVSYNIVPMKPMIVPMDPTLRKK